MAARKKSDEPTPSQATTREEAGLPEVEGDGTRAEARNVSDATDGGEPSIREEIRDLPDDEKPDPTTIAQEEVLREESR